MLVFNIINNNNDGVCLQGGFKSVGGNAYVSFAFTLRSFAFIIRPSPA